MYINNHTWIWLFKFEYANVVCDSNVPMNKHDFGNKNACRFVKKNMQGQHGCLILKRKADTLHSILYYFILCTHKINYIVSCMLQVKWICPLNALYKLHVNMHKILINRVNVLSSDTNSISDWIMNPFLLAVSEVTFFLYFLYCAVSS